MKELASILAAGIYASIIYPAVTEQRGYMAVGGEWILIIAFGVCTYMMINAWEASKLAKREKR